MPSTRLLALAPAPGQQLQLLRSAATGGPGGARSSDRSRRANSSSSSRSGRGGGSRRGGHGSRNRPVSRGTTTGRAGLALAASSRPMSMSTAARGLTARCGCAAADASGRLSSPSGRLLALCVAPLFQFHTWTRRHALPTVSSTAMTPSRRPSRLPPPPSPRPQQQQRTAAFGSATQPKQVAFPRHGKAVAPQPVADEAKTAQMPPSETSASPTTDDVRAGDAAGPARSFTASPAPPPQAATAAAAARDEKPGDGGAAPMVMSGADAAGEAATAAAAVAAMAATIVGARVSAHAGDGERVIELGPPRAEAGDADDAPPQEPAAASAAASAAPMPRQPLSQRTPPHLVAPLYVHHFDTYSLVKQLAAGGYTQAQAITAMKAVRLLLAQNLDVAQSTLVSKSDVENEAYLFKAACAELSIEVRNNRRRTDEQVRQQRTLLQSEVDIAGQSVTQDLEALTDVVKGLFNDRNMVVREEQKTRDNAIQEINYKITIMLNSEMRSDIEGLRWVLIRRSVIGIIFMAVLSLGALRYASFVSHERQKEAERVAREAREAEAQRYADSRIDTSAPPDAAEILAAN